MAYSEDFRKPVIEYRKLNDSRRSSKDYEIYFYPKLIRGKSGKRNIRQIVKTSSF